MSVGEESPKREKTIVVDILEEGRIVVVDTIVEENQKKEDTIVVVGTIAVDMLEGDTIVVEDNTLAIEEGCCSLSFHCLVAFVVLGKDKDLDL